MKRFTLFFTPLQPQPSNEFTIFIALYSPAITSWSRDCFVFSFFVGSFFSRCHFNSCLCFFVCFRCARVCLSSIANLILNWNKFTARRWNYRAVEDLPTDEQHIACEGGDGDFHTISMDAKRQTKKYYIYTWMPIRFRSNVTVNRRSAFCFLHSNCVAIPTSCDGSLRLCRSKHLKHK